MGFTEIISVVAVIVSIAALIVSFWAVYENRRSAKEVMVDSIKKHAIELAGKCNELYNQPFPDTPLGADHQFFLRQWNAGVVSRTFESLRTIDDNIDRFKLEGSTGFLYGQFKSHLDAGLRQLVLNEVFIGYNLEVAHHLNEIRARLGN